MNIKQLLIGGMVTLLTLGLFGTAFAGESVLERDAYNFNAQLTQADMAAMNYMYDQSHLAKVGTELGNSGYQFDSPETKADIAARNHVYDSEQLSNVGSESGNWKYSFDTMSSQSAEPKCSNC